MSRTTVLAIWPGERLEILDELHNSWGSAIPVWAAMAARYLNVHKSHDHPKPGYMQLGQKLWDLWQREDIPVTHRAVFMLTFDRAYVTQKDYWKMADSIRQFLKDFPPEPTAVNHWPRIAEILEGNPDIPAIGLWCTSVSENPFCGGWDEEKDEEKPPDWSRCYDLYEHLADPVSHA